MKLILSRKGFDASAGGGPSPILPDGRLLPLPIPDRDSPVRYADLQIGGLDLGPLIAPLCGGRWSAGDGAHLDPDVDATARASRPPGWRALFGQCGAAQAHLERTGVGVGDLFLFFGWFRRAVWDAGSLRWAPDARDRHVIFGWLQVGAVHRVGPRTLSRIPYAARHPHLHGSRGRLNTLYVARRRLALPGLARRLPGAGRFGRFRAALRLSDPRGPRRSEWRLPAWWHPHGRRSALSFHGARERWGRAGSSVRLRTVGRGQEFVLDLDHYPEALPWLAAGAFRGIA